jgi:DUF2075 family protein
MTTASVGSTTTIPIRSRITVRFLSRSSWSLVYKVLLTRGLIGCVIYSTDPETRALLAKLGVPPT